MGSVPYMVVSYESRSMCPANNARALSARTVRVWTPCNDDQATALRGQVFCLLPREGIAFWRALLTCHPDPPRPAARAHRNPCVYGAGTCRHPQHVPPLCRPTACRPPNRFAAEFKFWEGNSVSKLGPLIAGGRRYMARRDPCAFVASSVPLIATRQQ